MVLCLHDGQQVGEVLVHGGGDGHQLIAAGLHHSAARQVARGRGAAHQILFSYLQRSYSLDDVKYDFE